MIDDGNQVSRWGRKTHHHLPIVSPVDSTVLFLSPEEVTQCTTTSTDGNYSRIFSSSNNLYM
ncbi:hypothetical protein OUZ56_008423 [Daphnia magna]|uniref:Uncharacterized protein n=1 Tax=Daphnia magna TaxID=35525 RepID=A0ABR0ACZ0_9CRUS|nr:hypothetical protein OUZ56_008423 [Daphnia magna]